MAKTRFHWLLIGLAALGLADCSAIERSGSTPYNNSDSGVYFRYPKGGSVSDTKDSVTVKISNSASLVVSSQDETKSNPIEASDRAADALIDSLKKAKWDASKGGILRVDGTYMRLVTATQKDQSKKVWVVAVPHDFKDYFFTFTASKSDYNSQSQKVGKLMATVEFVKETPIVWDNVFFTVTTKNQTMWMFILIAIISTAFLWKDFWIDLWRLVVAPADVFRDVGRGATIIYPVLVVFITGILLAATVLSFRNQILQNADETVMQRAKARSTAAIEKATTDADARAILLYDIRRRALIPYEEVLSVVPFWVPLVPLILWLSTAFGLFLGVKVGRGQTTLLWVLKGSAFLFVPLFFAMYFATFALLGGNLMIPAAVAAIFFLWWLVLLFIAAREFGHFRRGEAIIALFFALFFMGLGVYGLSSIWTSQYGSKFGSGYSPTMSLIKNLQL